jgi:uncharacterized phage protein (TIGR02218 family)
MKAISPALASHLASGSTSLCSCWRLNRRDGVSFGFTDHDCDLAFGGTTFAAASGLSGSDVETALVLAVSGSDIQGTLTSAVLSEADILTGRLDGASVETWLVNWQDVSQRILQDVSTIGEIRRMDHAFTAELRGPAAAYDEEKGRLYRRECDAAFGDARCGLSLAQNNRRLTLPVTAVPGDSSVQIAAHASIPANALLHGNLRFTNGTAQGIEAAIRSHSRQGGFDVLVLDRPILTGFAVGDVVELTIGCDKRFATCRAFGNQLNFRGFPHVPTNDQVFGYAERGTANNDGGSLFQ